MTEFNLSTSEKIKEIIEQTLEPSCTLLEFATVRLYIAYDDTPLFKYTDLEGILCLVINRQLSGLFIQIYEYVNFKKEFEIELYTNIEKGYVSVEDKFHTIEFPSFFIGLNFANAVSASRIKNAVMYNSLLLNSPTTLYFLQNFKKEESDRSKSEFVSQEINDTLLEIPENENPERIITFGINREFNNVIMDIDGEGFKNYLQPMNVYETNIESHYFNKIRDTLKKTDIVSGTNAKVTSDTTKSTKFVEYDVTKRKSLLKKNNTIQKSIPIKPQPEVSFQDTSSNTLTKFFKKQVKNAPPKTLQEAITQGVKLKPIPKNEQKKPIKVTPLSQDPALQLGMRLQRQTIKEESDDGFDDDE